MGSEGRDRPTSAAVDLDLPAPCREARCWRRAGGSRGVCGAGRPLGGPAGPIPAAPRGIPVAGALQASRDQGRLLDDSPRPRTGSAIERDRGSVLLSTLYQSRPRSPVSWQRLGAPSPGGGSRRPRPRGRSRSAGNPPTTSRRGVGEGAVSPRWRSASRNRIAGPSPDETDSVSDLVASSGNGSPF